MGVSRRVDNNYLRLIDNDIMLYGTAGYCQTRSIEVYALKWSHTYYLQKKRGAASVRPVHDLSRRRQKPRCCEKPARNVVDVRKSTNDLTCTPNGSPDKSL